MFVALWHDLEVRKRLTVLSQMCLPNHQGCLSWLLSCGGLYLKSSARVMFLQWRLLSWSWLICLAFLPELFVKRLAQSPALDRWRHTWGEGPPVDETHQWDVGDNGAPSFVKNIHLVSAVFRYACALGAALNIMALMAANLVGFVLGPARLKGNLHLHDATSCLCRLVLYCSSLLADRFFSA
jgi:hypothetical protein